MNTPQCRLACDAMLGKLARWLRAAGCDVTWTEGIDDDDLLRHARAEGRVVVTSDGPLMAHRLVRDGTVRAVFVPVHLATLEQLGHVMRRLGLTPGEPRCMTCGGALLPLTRDDAAGLVPPRVLALHRGFRRCSRCGKVYWPGTHWKRIEVALRDALARKKGHAPSAADEKGDT